MATATLAPTATTLNNIDKPSNTITDNTMKSVPIDNTKTDAKSILNNYNDTSLYEPELHIIGEIVSATNISYHNCFAYYRFVSGSEWTCVGGNTVGQTHVDYPYTSILQSLLSTLTHSTLSNTCIFNHAVDLHYYTNTLKGWPKLVIELYTLDSDSNHHIIGYGFVYIPCHNGTHNLTINLFRPLGTFKEELINIFTPNTPSLISTECVHNAVKAKDDRPLLSTESVGQVQVRLDIMLRNMSTHVIT